MVVLKLLASFAWVAWLIMRAAEAVLLISDRDS